MTDFQATSHRQGVRSRLKRSVTSAGLALRLKGPIKPMNAIQAITTPAQSVSERYHYRPLDKDRQQIRVLVLYARSRSAEDTVRCTMKTVSLRSFRKPRYETISYAWGDKIKCANIEIDGLTLETTASAERALRRMRLPHRDSTLWIDAVCINQNDLAERGHQVTLMAAVYTNTTRNLIWLGDSDGSTRNALNALNVVLSDARRRTSNFESLFDTIYDANGTVIIASTGLAQDVDYESLRQFFKLPWFRRLWVVQEAALAPLSLCHCGDYEVALIDVLRAAAWFAHMFHHIPNPVRASTLTVYQIWTFADSQYGLFRHRGQFHPKLLNLLRALQDFEVHESRDHVFGLLGLYQKFNRSEKAIALLAPDYTKSLADVLRDATRAVIEERQDLEFIRNVNRRSEQSLEDRRFPTWVPRWDRGWDQDLDPAAFRSGYQADGSRGKALFITPSSEDANALPLRGTVVATVGRTLNPIMRTSTTVEYLDVIASFRALAEDLATEDGRYAYADEHAVATTPVAAYDHRQDRDV